MQKWIAFYTNDGADRSDESEWGICDTQAEAEALADHWRNFWAVSRGYRFGAELVECPAAWLQIQLENNYDGTTADDEHFWPIPNWGG
jgi:hypothetical protein